MHVLAKVNGHILLLFPTRFILASILQSHFSCLSKLREKINVMVKHVVKINIPIATESISSLLVINAYLNKNSNADAIEPTSATKIITLTHLFKLDFSKL